MKDYRSYMDNVSVDEALHNKIMNRITQRPVPRRAVLGRYVAVCAGACAMLAFLSVWAFPNLFPPNTAIPPVSRPDAPASSVPVPPYESDVGNKADLDQYKQLSLAQAQADPAFGAYVPKNIPGFNFESAILNQKHDGLRLEYAKGMKHLSLAISHKTAEDEARVVDISKPETYDLVLYPIPRSESVPDELRAIVTDPVFKAEDLTLKTVRARAYTVDEFGDVDNTEYRMRFSVLDENVVVQLKAKGAQPELVFNLLKEVVLSN